MDENKFWLGLFGIFAGVVIAVAVVTAVYYDRQGTKIVAMVEAGANPIAARCSLYESFAYEGSALICMEVVKK